MVHVVAARCDWFGEEVWLEVLHWTTGCVGGVWWVDLLVCARERLLVVVGGRVTVEHRSRLQLTFLCVVVVTKIVELKHN